MSKFKQWDVWYVDQEKSRANSDPQQPKDASGKTRMYIIVCPDAHLRSGGYPVCVPIGTKPRSALTDAYLCAGDGDVTNECHAWCNEIFTLNPAHFIKKIGHMPNQVHTQIRDALRDFFELH